MLYALGDIEPQLRADCWIADNATLIGDVVLEDQSSIWFNAVLRGDVEPLHIGERSNIQDGAVIHSDPGMPVMIGRNVTVGHKVMLHGCTIGDRCLIGRGSAIVGHLSIEVGDDVFTGMNVYVTDQNHGYEDVDQPIGIQVPSEEPVSIGAGSWIGSGAVSLPGAQLGEHVVVAANSVVRGEVPSYSVVAGVPARVVRRYEAGEWRRVDRP